MTGIVRDVRRVIEDDEFFFSFKIGVVIFSNRGTMNEKVSDWRRGFRRGSRLATLAILVFGRVFRPSSEAEIFHDSLTESLASSRTLWVPELVPSRERRKLNLHPN